MKYFIIVLAFFMLLTEKGHAQDLTQSDKECLTKALYHEARGEPDHGMFAVASVVLNRTNSNGFPSDVCSVISQRGQFTYDKRKKMSESASVAKVQSVISAIETGFAPIYNFLYFHRTDVVGQCTTKKNKMRIGNHYFCR